MKSLRWAGSLSAKVRIWDRVIGSRVMADWTMSMSCTLVRGSRRTLRTSSGDNWEGGGGDDTASFGLEATPFSSALRFFERSMGEEECKTKP